MIHSLGLSEEMYFLVSKRLAYLLIVLYYLFCPNKMNDAGRGTALDPRLEYGRRHFLVCFKFGFVLGAVVRESVSMSVSANSDLEGPPLTVSAGQRQMTPGRHLVDSSYTCPEYPSLESDILILVVEFRSRAGGFVLIKSYVSSRPTNVVVWLKATCHASTATASDPPVFLRDVRSRLNNASYKLVANIHKQHPFRIGWAHHSQAKSNSVVGTLRTAVIHWDIELAAMESRR